MTASLEEQMKKQQDLTWTKSNIAEITTSLSGVETVESLAEHFYLRLFPLSASHAVFYVDMDEKNKRQSLHYVLPMLLESANI